MSKEAKIGFALAGAGLFFGIIASYLVAVKLLNVGSVYFIHNMWNFTHGKDIIMAMSKAFVFAILIVFIGCQQGLTTRNGAVGVGRATTYRSPSTCR